MGHGRIIQIVGYALLISLSLCFIVFADLYTWEDEDGKVRITQTTPPEGVTVLKTIVHPTGTPTQFETQRRINQYFDWRTPYIKNTPTPGGADQNWTPTPETYSTATPYLDKNGHDEQWWRKRKSDIEMKLSETRNLLEESSNQLRIMYQGSTRADAISAHREKHREMEQQIKTLEEELEGLDVELKDVDGLPGWLR